MNRIIELPDRQRGDEQLLKAGAIEELKSRYNEELRSAILRRLPDARDVLDRTWEIAVANFDQKKGAFRTWLFMVAFHLCQEITEPHTQSIIAGMIATGDDEFPGVTLGNVQELAEFLEGYFRDGDEPVHPSAKLVNLDLVDWEAVALDFCPEFWED